MFETFTIDSLAFFESIIHPAFADLVPQGFPYNGTLSEWTIMNDVPSKRPIVDIRRVQNILQRRDASCDINYKKVVGASTRQITTDEVYAATKFCRNSFYQGCLKDWRAADPLFGNKILPFFQGAVNIDIASNGYFGDVDRVPVPNAQWSTNIYDGVFKWIKRYLDAGVIPVEQTTQITDTDFQNNPWGAYQLLHDLYNKQPLLMNSFQDTQKAFYVSKEIATAYEDYLIQIGANRGNYQVQIDGISYLAYKGIPLIVEPIWTPIISELKGSPGYAAILTLRGNFVFATDKEYGEGEDGKTALEIWYEKKEMTFYYRLFLKAGTQIALPEFICFAISSWE